MRPRASRSPQGGAAARRLRALLAGVTLFAGWALVVPSRAMAQEDPGRSPSDTVTAADSSYPNDIAGEFTPSKGFDLVHTQRGSLNISMYGLFRYLNQLPDSQRFEDHLGRTRFTRARNDLNWHRTMVWLTGFFWFPQFRYNITLWSLPTTQQTLLFGNMLYRFDRAFIVGVGIAPNLTARSMTGSWPFWASSDRQMAEDFFRGGFSSGLFVTGEPVPRLIYTASINTNISQLGVPASADTRDFAVSGSLQWLPTTGEFGPRGGLGDLEYHERLATRFGLSLARSREARYANDSVPPLATQIKLSDGTNPFDFGALAPGVTVLKLTYALVAADAGFKYHGFSFQSEYYVRQLSNFLTDVPLPPDADDPILDHGFQVQAMHMVVPRRLGVYLTYGQVFDEFKRRPWEIATGASYYPAGNRSWRLNLHLIRVERSPAASNFGFYTAGQSGPIISIGTDILL